MMLECEIKIDGQWIGVGIDDALEKYGIEQKRCKDCHGPVHAYPEGIAPAHFGHTRAYAGCPTTLHPNAVT
jgi:hypothetical protein